MPPKKSTKKAPSHDTTKKDTAAAVARVVKHEEQSAETVAWIEKNDPLLDRCAEPGQSPITIDYLFASKLTHKTFNPRVEKTKVSQPQSFDWSNFRAVLEGRTAQSPRWFIQLREEDLLLGPDGLDGVAVDCFVVAEASVPTLSPAEYVVKEHWPYSDAEDNAPERILPLEGQGMCWRRVVKDDGSDINVFLLQRRSDPTTAAAAASASAAAAASFGFGTAPKPANTTATSNGTVTPGLSSTTNTSANTSFSFGFGASAAPASAPAPAAPTSTTFSFGFGTAGAAAPAPAPAAPASTSAGTSFGFGFGAAATPAPAAPTPASTAPIAFSFGSATPAVTAPTPAVTISAQDDPAIRVKPLKTTEVLFSLWSSARLAEMETDVKSGSRIVRPGFVLHAPETKVKLVMDNDLNDDVDETVHGILLHRLFAKTDSDVKEVDAWMEACPVFDEELTEAMQDFRKRFLDETASESEAFRELKTKYGAQIKAELERIVAIRKASAQIELDRIAAIQTLVKEKKLAEKSSFRLLKYYAKNDVLPFRPFGKISGISESGEAVDVCEPPAHVNINPFTGKPM